MPQTGKDRFLARLDALNMTPCEFLNTLAMWDKLPEADRLEIEADTLPLFNTDRIDYRRIQTDFNRTCGSYPAILKLSDARKKTVKARIGAGYTYEDFHRLFEMAEESSFLKGKNERGWRATFDWLIKDANMAKVLDGNYVDKKNATGSRGASFDLTEIGSLLDDGLL